MSSHRGKGRGRGNHDNNNNNNRSGNDNGNGNRGGNRNENSHDRGNNGNNRSGHRTNGNRNWNDNNNRPRNGDRSNGRNNNRGGISKGYNNNNNSRRNSKGSIGKTMRGLVLDAFRAPIDAVDPRPFIELSVATSLAGGLLIDTLVKMDFTNREIARTLAVPLGELLQLHSITRMLIDGNREPDGEGDHPMFDAGGRVDDGRNTNDLARGDGQDMFATPSNQQIALARILAPGTPSTPREHIGVI